MYKPIYILFSDRQGWIFGENIDVLALTKKRSEFFKKEDFMATKKDGNWIAGAIKKPGALRKTLGVKKGEKIPAAKLAKAAKSKNPTTRKRAALAKTLKGFKK